MRKGFKILTIATALLAIVEIIVFNALEFDDPMWKWDFHYYMQWTFIILCPVCACVWYYYYTAEVKEQERVETLKRKEEERIRKEEKKVEVSKAYDSISDIWEYCDRTIMAVQSSPKLISILYVNLNYSSSGANRWTLNVQLAEGDVFSFKVNRQGDRLVGTNESYTVTLTKGQLVLNDMLLFYDPQNEIVQKADSIMQRLRSGMKIEAVRQEHLKVGEELWDTLPKFHFTISDKGIKCDEINYPKMQLDAFFKKNNGGDHLWQNSVYYADYCKNGNLKIYLPGEEHLYEEYQRRIAMMMAKPEHSRCNTNYDISRLYIEVTGGINDLFRSIKSYVAKKTIDVVPAYFSDNTIIFKHKNHSANIKKGEVDRCMAKLQKIMDLQLGNGVNTSDTVKLARMLAVTQQRHERLNDNAKLNYAVSISDESIMIQINEESFVSVIK